MHQAWLLCLNMTELQAALWLQLVHNPSIKTHYQFEKTSTSFSHIVEILCFGKKNQLKLPFHTPPAVKGVSVYFGYFVYKREQLKEK